MAAENPEEMENNETQSEQPEAAETTAETSEPAKEPDAAADTEESPAARPEPVAETGEGEASGSALSESESAADAPDLEKLKKIVEGAIFAAAKPMTIDNLGALFGEDERPSREDFRAVLAALTEEYADRGVMLREVSSGFRFQVREEVGQWVSRLWEEKPARYSRALLETLALIAYRQPITRGEIEEIRGVSTSSNIMKTLQERDWIRVVGHRDVPGRPAMYATTRQFLDYFNLKNIDELPSLAEIRDLDEINRELDLGSNEAATPDSAEADAEAVEATEGAALGQDEPAVAETHEAETPGIEDSDIEAQDVEAHEAETPDSENEQQTEVDSKETGYTS